MKEKIKKLQEVLKTQKEEYLFLDWEDPNHTWLLERKLENSFIIVKAKGKPVILVGSLEHFESKEFEVKPLKKENFPKRAVVNKKTYKIKYDDFIKSKPIHFDVRNIKTEQEINNIKKSCFHTDKCFKLILEGLKNKKYKKEVDVEKEIRIYAIKNNLKLAFNPIVASGKNASVPHHDNSSKLMKGFCVIDFGFKYKEYCSDMTRTVYLGKPTKKEQEIYNLVLSAQKKALKKIKPKLDLNKLDSFVREELKEYAKHFIHSLGHGLGVEVHESPFFKDNVLKKGGVITIEPGIYLKNKFGIRIEDTVLVGKAAIILTKSSKNIIKIN